VQWPTLNHSVNKNAAIEEKIDRLLIRMSLEEKVGQMIQPEIHHLTPQDVTEYHIGSVLKSGGSFSCTKVADWLAIADACYSASMDESDGLVAIPLMWGADAVLGGDNMVGSTVFPRNIALGAARNPELIKHIGEITAREMAIRGLDWSFSPNVAVARDDRWARTYTSFSEHPELVRRYSTKMVEGLQGTASGAEFLSDTRVIATAKHFLGDGGTQSGIDRGNCCVSEEELRDIHGAGYFSAIEAGVQCVMASFSSWHGEQMHGHKYLLTEVLKGKLGFDGIVVGNWNGQGFVSGSSILHCSQAIIAGLDIFMVSDSDWKILYTNTLEQTITGVIPGARIDDAVRRILRVKLRAGLWEKGLPSLRPLAGKVELLGAHAHRAVARQAVRESLVLLKNKNKLLPLSPSSNILVTGDGAENISKQIGSCSVDWQGTGNTSVDFCGSTTILSGISEKVSAAGGHLIFSPDGNYLQKPDVAIVIFGEDPYAEIQSDLQHLLFNPGENKDLGLLKKLQAEQIPVVALFITGRPLWVNRELNASDAFVVVWQPGTEGGGVADVLFKTPEGKVNYDTTGRLTFSWPKRPDQEPQNVGDKFYDPLFAYGFGLSYADTDKLGDNLSEDCFQEQSTANVLELFAPFSASKPCI
jgi:beta-glucosidase